MKTTSIRARAIACALLATTATLGLAAAPANAQTFPTSRPAPDPNGVDVITGDLHAPLRSVSIGAPGESALTFLKGYADGMQQDTFVLEMLDGGSVVQLNIHGRTVNFTKNSSGVFAPDDADGSTFVLTGGNYVYTARDGTKIDFSPAYGDTGVSLLTARGTKITRPDGEVLNYHYRVESPPSCPIGQICLGSGGIRVQSVTSNLGFQLKAYYGENYFLPEEPDPEWFRLSKVVAINTAVDYCSPSADTCPTFTKAWPEVTLGRSTSGSTTTDTLTDNLSNTVTVTSSGSAPTAIRSPADPANDLSLTYDGNGRVATLSRGGGTWGYSYADSGSQRTTTVTQPLGGSRVYVSDVNLRRVLSVTDELGKTTSYQYDGNGRRTRISSPEGNYVQLTYDARGNVTQARNVAKSGSGLSDIVSSAAFASTCSNAKTCNKPISTTDARGKVTNYTYDGNHGGVLTATAPAPTSGAVRPQTRYSYSSLYAYQKSSTGSIVAALSPVTKLTGVSACKTGSSCAGTADEVKSTIAYGSTGVANNLLPTSISNGNGAGTLTATHTAGWDAFGNLTSLDGPLSGTADTTGYRYDTARRLVMTVSPDPDGGGTLKHRAQRLTYNGDGNVTKAESGTTTTLTGTFSPVSSGERVEIAYDTLGRKTKESLVSGTGTINALTQFSYDTKGRLSCTAQRMNPAVFGSLPASACTLGTTGSFGPDRITKAVYNNRNEVTQNQVAVGTTVQANEQTLTWTDNGRLASLKDGENNLTTYIHDGHDRLSQTRFPSPTKGAGTSSTTDYEQLAYDANGNVTSRRLRDGQSIAFTFDALNRATLKNLPGTEPDVTYTYDNLGRMTGASQTGNVLSFTFDALGRNLTQAGPHGTVSSAWDLAGRRTRLTYPGSGLYVDQDYLVTGEVAKLRENGATSGAGVLATFAYDDLGRRTSLTRGNATVTSYSHDPISRLTSLTQDLASTTNDLTIGSMSYNPASQIISQSRSNDGYAWTGHYNLNSNYTANGLNQYIVTGSITPTYDPRGNLTSAGGATFSYSSENMLTSASGGVSLAYDPMLRLYQTVGSTTTRMAYDGLDLIAEYNGSNALLRRYVHGPGMDEPLVWYEGTGTTDRRWLHGDERGSIVAISNGSGAATTINRYDEYGTPGSSNAGRFQYTGQQWLPELGMYHYKARIYSPTLGRFLQTDSIGYEDGMNMYAYVGNDPVNFTDPLGLYSDIVVTACRWCFGSGGFGLSSSGSGISGGTAGEPPLPPRIQEALDEILVVGTRPPAPPRPAVSPAPIPAASATGPGRFMCEAAITPDGDTKGNNPRRGSSGYNTDLPGGLGTAYSVFIGLTRLAGDTNFQFGPLLRPDILLRSSRGIQLRIGDDGRPRIDIPANVLHLWRPETIHFTGGRGNICPTQ